MLPAAFTWHCPGSVGKKREKLPLYPRLLPWKPTNGRDIKAVICRETLWATVAAWLLYFSFFSEVACSLRPFPPLVLSLFSSLLLLTLVLLHHGGQSALCEMMEGECKHGVNACLVDGFVSFFCLFIIVYFLFRNFYLKIHSSSPRIEKEIMPNWFTGDLFIIFPLLVLYIQLFYFWIISC